MVAAIEPCLLLAPRQRVPMRTLITIAALSAAMALAVTAPAPSLNIPVVSQTAQAVLDGVILGSSAWPSVPFDARARVASLPAHPMFGSRHRQIQSRQEGGIAVPKTEPLLSGVR